MAWTLLEQMQSLRSDFNRAALLPNCGSADFEMRNLLGRLAARAGIPKGARYTLGPPVMTVRAFISLGALALAAFWPSSARGHTPSETYLTLFVTPTNVVGQWDVAILDLRQGLRIEPDAFKALAADEQQRRLEALAIDTVTGLDVQADEKALELRVTDLETVTLNLGEYARVKFAAPAGTNRIAAISINARSLFRVDTNMHGLLRVEHEGRMETATFREGASTRVFSLAEPASRVAQAWTYLRDGAEHICKGPDHVLFLIALLLPAVLKREAGAWKGAEAFRPAAWNILKIVTAFTIAHSVTLSLAVLGIVTAPARVVEPIIAASVIAAAVNNVRPWFGERGWMVAFGFGLVHGLGLAGGLIEFGLRQEALVLALVSFNVGVELGQLAIVALFFPLAFGLRQTMFYREVTLKFGSAAVALVAAVWMAERVFNFKLLPEWMG